MKATVSCEIGFPFVNSSFLLEPHAKILESALETLGLVVCCHLVVA